MDDQTLLALVDQQISALLTGGAVKSWSEGGHQVTHMSITELYGLKQQLENRIAQSTQSTCIPIVSRDF